MTSEIRELDGNASALFVDGECRCIAYDKTILEDMIKDEFSGD